MKEMHSPAGELRIEILPSRQLRILGAWLWYERCIKRTFSLLVEGRVIDVRPAAATFQVLIVATGAYAGVVGCQIDSKFACAVGPPSATEIIRTALQAANFIGRKFADDNVVWAGLAACYVLIILGWSRFSSRVVLALGASTILGFLPYFGPILTMTPLVNPKCNPNEGGVPPNCIIYGGDVRDAANDAVRLGWKFFYGAPVALGAFVIFALLMLVFSSCPAGAPGRTQGGQPPA